MKALLLNSGLGSRMGELTANMPKTMIEINKTQTIIARQLSQLKKAGINDIVITTGPFEDVLKEYVMRLFPEMNFTFVRNDIYDKTNYIYSIYLAREYLDDDIIMLHGDLVFEDGIIEKMLKCADSLVTVSFSANLPEKDFKGVIDKTNIISKIGIEYFDQAVALQPLYKLNRADWRVWLNNIIRFCEKDDVRCYAEKALNEITDEIKLLAFDCGDKLCNEIDNIDDLKYIRNVFDRRGQ